MHHKTGTNKGLEMPMIGSKESKQPSSKASVAPQPSSWFSLPAPIRQIFNTFPLVTYDDNDLPQRVSTSRQQNQLHIFTIEGDQLSPNPACLKWQAYLLAKRITFSTVSANNHASPTGALPFIIPGSKKRDPQPQAISSSKLQRWAETQGAAEERLNIRLEAYLSLIDQNIRNAWLYYLYIQEQNFQSVAMRLYIDPASSNFLVQTALAHQLQSAAKEQLLRTRSHIDGEEIYDAADAAFRSLEMVLASDKFFTKSDSPGLFDVTLFSYTHLLLHLARDGSDDQKPMWSDRTLLEILERYHGLVEHRNRVFEFCMAQQQE